MPDTVQLDPEHEISSSNGHEPSWIETEDELALRQLIFQAQDRPEELVEIPEWKTKVLVRALSGTQRAVYEAIPRDPSTNKPDLARTYAELVIMACYHPRTRKPVFKFGDRMELMDQKNGAIIDKIAIAALRVSQMLPKQQKTTAKNSEAIPTSTTTTDSPSDLDISE